MEFGKLDSIGGVDFALPEDRPEVAVRLARFSDSPQPAPEDRVRLGAARWQHPGFVGKIYPPGTRGAAALKAYVRQFRCIELNTTFYGFDEDRLGKWAAAAPEGFLFAPKFPGAITHAARLRGIERSLDAWLRALDRLGPHCGTAWALLPEDFAPGSGGFQTLREFLERLPGGFASDRRPERRFGIELRHPDWFGPARQAVFGLCDELGITVLCTDVAGRRDVCHAEPVTPHFALRFVGNRLDPTDFERLERWVDRLGTWFDRGLRSAEIWLHQPEDDLVVELAEHLAPRLAERTGLPVRAPERVVVHRQLGLFGTDDA